jgi:hypothetical protein
MRRMVNEVGTCWRSTLAGLDPLHVMAWRPRQHAGWWANFLRSGLRDGPVSIHLPLVAHNQ